METWRRYFIWRFPQFGDIAIDGRKVYKLRKVCKGEKVSRAWFVKLTKVKSE